MAGLLDVYARRADTLAQGINSLEQGLATSFDYQGTSYNTANRDTLDLLYELALLRAAREAILAGGQQYTLLGRTFQKADFKDITAEIQRIELAVTKTTRGGITVRQVVPL